MEECQGGFGPLILIAAVRVKPVPATPRRGIVQGQSQIVMTQEPVEGPMKVQVPLSAIGDSFCRQARGHDGLGLDGLLIEPSPLATTGEKSIRADGHEMAL